MRWTVGQASNLLLALSLLAGGPVNLAAQDASTQDVLKLDLGIVIEATGRDSAAAETSEPGDIDVGLTVGKAPPGAEFIATSKELRSTLDALSGQILTLETSLNQDVEAVRLENERLRSLIRKIQTSRKEEQAVAAAGRLEEENQPIEPPAPAHSWLERPGYRQVMLAYRNGSYRETAAMCAALDKSTLLPEQATQVAYWWADALFREGRFDDALRILQPLAAASAKLGDDAIVLEGLIYLRQGKPGLARSRYEDIVSRYPASEYYRLAQLNLRELNDH
ncbi:MAG: hypothetical protein V3U35_02480 [Candidatus Neomarinimicrobiota bacterium]